ncbi:MAG: GNAT family N-acetyltransferase [Oscillospiraceae bacterium]
MQIQLKPARRGTPDYKKMKRLYKQAFPAAERAPFWILSAKAKKENVDFWAIYADGTWVGLLYVVNHETLSYLFYFAVTAGERGKGYGSGALEAAKAQYAGRRLFLAIEQTVETAVNHDERVRRKAFYLRNGFTDLNLKLREASVVYDLLGIGGAVDADEYDRLMQRYLGGFFKKLVTMKILAP